jgi:serine/threonine-protein kinase HipA
MGEMISIDKLFVKYHGKTVGELTLTPDGTRCAFRYDKEWMATGFSISPLDLPLKPDLFIAHARPFWGNFGIFEDSLPDGYGRYLLNRMLRQQGVDDTHLTPLQRLSIVGSSGMGRYATSLRPVCKEWMNGFRLTACSSWPWKSFQRRTRKTRQSCIIIAATLEGVARNAFITTKKENG